jgi:glutamyl-tRNA reductase
MDRLAQELIYADIAVFCSGAGNMVDLRMVKAALMARHGHPLFLVDLAVPRNIELACGGLEGCFLYGLDDLAAIANENLKRRGREMERCRLHAARFADECWGRVEKILAKSVVDCGASST